MGGTIFIFLLSDDFRPSTNHLFFNPSPGWLSILPNNSLRRRLYARMVSFFPCLVLRTSAMISLSSLRSRKSFSKALCNSSQVVSLGLSASEYQSMATPHRVAGNRTIHSALSVMPLADRIVSHVRQCRMGSSFPSLVNFVNFCRYTSTFHGGGSICPSELEFNPPGTLPDTGPLEGTSSRFGLLGPTKLL